MTKFAYVGVVSTITDYAVYALLLYFQTPYYLAIIVGYSTGVVVNFFLTRKYVFTKCCRFDSAYKEFLAVFVVSMVAVVLNIAIVSILYDYGANYYIGRIVAIVLVFFFNYVMRKRYIYNGDEL